ncbi:MAG: hypothetical protein ABIL69_01885 [candidate division WOR-3 bacterium]
MKKLKIIFPILYFVSVILLIIHSDCKNPDEYKPKGDSLLPPPAPPRLLTPPDSFVHMPFGSPRLIISWENIEDAEIYEINFVAEKGRTWTLQLDTNALIQSWADTLLFDKYKWKVRAYSSKWDYYTNWSEEWHFEVNFRFLPPTPLFPKFDTSLYFDSLPAPITFHWTEVTNAQYYNIRLYRDTTYLFDYNVSTNSETIIIDTSGIYYWQVLAGNKNWQYDTGWSFKSRFRVFIGKK